MVEVTKPDYLSLVNKGGSGFNVSELVTSMVASEIEPKRILQNSKLEKTENAISGIGYLNSQAATTQGNFTTISGDTFFEIASSNSSSIDLVITDETKLNVSNRTISNMQLAKRMVFEFGGFSDLTTPIADGGVEIDFGTWDSVPAESSDSTQSYSAGKTYEVLVGMAAGAADSDISDLISNTDWNGDPTAGIPSGSTFTVNEPFVGGSLINGYIREIDSYAFEPNSDNTTQDFDFTGENLTQIAARFNAVSGITAQIVDTTGDGDSYSLVISGEATGLSQGFRITEKSGGARWETPLVTLGHQNASGFTQFSRNASITLDGVEISRSDNEISDLIEGANILIKSDSSDDISLSISRSETAIRQSINDTIFSLNEFKDEIDRLTFIDIEGDENGPLALETAATMLKTNFKKLAIEPLVGYGSDAIYLSQLGIKTNSNGQYYLDDAIFEKTLSNNPDYFLALKDANLSSSRASAVITKNAITDIPPGTYTVLKDGANWKFGDTLLTTDGNGYFSSSAYPGLVINTAEANPAQFDVYVGKSFAQKMIDLMTDTLDLNSSLRSAEDSYKSLTEDIEARLEKLDEREKLISSRYTEQFGAMEQAMTQFNSTKSMLENFIESWKKQK